MIRKLVTTMVVGVSALVLCGCAMVVAPVNGMFYGDVQWAQGATSNASWSKSGSGVCKTYLGLFSQGDASIESIAKSAGITRIHHIDAHSKNIWVLYGEYTVTVYGD